MERVFVRARVSQQDADRLAVRASKDHTTMSELIRQAIEEFLSRRSIRIHFPKKP